MTEQNEIITPVFKNKPSNLQKHSFTARPAVKINVNEVELTISLFLFCGGRNNRFKGLFWDGEGFIMLYKRFENGHLSWPRNNTDAKELSAQQLNWLLQGLNPFPTRKIMAAHPGTFY